MRALKKISAFIIILGFACTGTKKLYYPIVSERSGSRVTVEIERKNDVITISFPDSVLRVGDTVKFTKGAEPLQIKIIDTHGDYQSYIIRP